MEAIKFKLGGIGAVFKRPQTNSAVNLTYSHIHKVALLGMFGAILGLKGHNDIRIKYSLDYKKLERIFPEFYEKLHGLQVSIVPDKDNYPRKAHKKFTETTGFCNKGCSLIVNEQFIVNPNWTIYIMQGDVSRGIYDKLKQSLLNKEAVFEPYLGRNHFPADIREVEIVDLEENTDPKYIDSLFIKSYFKTAEDDFDLDDQKIEVNEIMPVAMSPQLNNYVPDEVCYTNKQLTKINETVIYKDSGINLFFI